MRPTAIFSLRGICNCLKIYQPFLFSEHWWCSYDCGGHGLQLRGCPRSSTSWKTATWCHHWLDCFKAHPSPSKWISYTQTWPSSGASPFVLIVIFNLYLPCVKISLHLIPFIIYKWNIVEHVCSFHDFFLSQAPDPSLPSGPLSFSQPPKPVPMDTTPPNPPSQQETKNNQQVSHSKQFQPCMSFAINKRKKNVILVHLCAEQDTLCSYIFVFVSSL